MITTVCMNPAIDKSAVAEQLHLMEVNRLEDIRTAIGGKGINVAIVLRRLQADVDCASIVGDADERFFTRAMELTGVPLDSILVSGNVRCNLKVLDENTNVLTEFNEQGPTVEADALDALEGVLRRKAESSGYIALCGSLPPGCPPDTYQTLMRNIPAKRWVVDTSGEELRHALTEKPFLIKPNLPELEELTGARLPSVSDALAAARRICEGGVSYVLVSLGVQGALVTDGQKTLFSPAVPVKAGSALGAGDAMLAGILYGLGRGESVFDSLRYGTAAGAACVQDRGIASFNRQTFDSFLPHVKTKWL